MKNTILYYPTIKIKDGYWLRNAILYWENVASIVPGYDYDEFNSFEVEYLRDANIYKPIYPVGLEYNEKLCNQFCKEVKEKLVRNRSGKKYEKLSRVHKEKLAMSQSGMLHINKTPESILDFLKDEGIAMENCDGPWINMKTKDAEIYMSILAKYLAKLEGDTDIGTDLVRKFFYPHVRENRRSKTDKQVYFDMALQEILPVPNMDGVTIDDIIKFKEKYKQELHYYRRRIGEFQDKLKYQTEDVEELREEIVYLKRETEEDLQMVESLLKQERISYKLGSLRTLIPIGLSAAIGIAACTGYLSEFEAVCAEILVNVATTVVCTKKEFSISENNAYLFYAKKNGII